MVVIAPPAACRALRVTKLGGVVVVVVEVLVVDGVTEVPVVGGRVMMFAEVVPELVRVIMFAEVVESTQGPNTMQFPGPAVVVICELPKVEPVVDGAELDIPEELGDDVLVDVGLTIELVDEVLLVVELVDEVLLVVELVDDVLLDVGLAVELVDEVLLVVALVDDVPVVLVGFVVPDVVTV